MMTTLSGRFEMPKYKKEHVRAVRKVARAKFAGNGRSHLKMMLGGDAVYRKLVMVHRNLMGATGASTETAKVLTEAIATLSEELELKPNVVGALNKMKSIAERGDKMSFDMLRNQIFKTADLLKVKLPSMMFASILADRDGNYMSVQNIRDIASMSQELSEHIQYGDDMPDWVEDKLSSARQAISDLHRYYRESPRK